MNGAGLARRNWAVAFAGKAERLSSQKRQGELELGREQARQKPPAGEDGRADQEEPGQHHEHAGIAPTREGRSHCLKAPEPAV